MICTGFFNDWKKQKIFSQSILKKLSLGLILFLKHVQPIGTLFFSFNLWTEHRSCPTGKNEKISLVLCISEICYHSFIMAEKYNAEKYNAEKYNAEKYKV